MQRIRTIPLVVFAACFGLSACNLPVSRAPTKVPSTVLTVGVSALAECRSGPGQEYTLIAALEPGQVVQAVGRSPAGDYLLIQHPSNSNILCWLMTASAAVVGNAADLPEVSVSAQASTLVAGCPSPVGGGPTPVDCSAGGPPLVAGCPSPVGGGPTPVDCSAGGAPLVAGCPSPVGGGPTPVDCSAGGPPLVAGCPSPIGGGPTPVDCSAGGPPLVAGCPSPVGGGPTPVDCSVPGGALPRRRATPVPGVPTLVGPTAVP